MKLLSICEPTQYGSPSSEIPIFYQRLALDPRVEFYHMPTSLVFAEQLPKVQVKSVEEKLTYEEFLVLSNAAEDWIDLENIDLVFCRTLKPFPTGYLDQLATWEKFTRFANCPSQKKEQIKPDFLFKVAKEYIPEALITNEWTQALEFFEQFQIVVAKQANSCGGRGVFKIWYQNGVFQVDNFLKGTRAFTQFSEVMSYLQEGQITPIQFFRYLRRTDAGDKRIVVVGGEIYGAYLRRSKSGHWINNVGFDGECTLADITKEEVEAIEHTVGHYQTMGLHTLGYDFLLDDDGTWIISEINAGNIGGFARLEFLTGQPIMDRLVCWLIEYAQRSPGN
ncbi:MAG: hypothetical protein F6J86_23470 [Symploca sp. SIO1B1]|nr:hypothetical protein [Symploca sp. SIO1C2]NER47433.1 hypothetical protein [Symploca sp. SIO1A3]NER96770.1 hypothetical protein [Symploca sp. SIO1B1]